MNDERFAGRALTLARRGRYRAAPNPTVGAVVVRNGQVVGEGYHRAVGGPHAEVHALGEAGAAARGATLYVTLEPCNHQGRTPPCSERVIEAGVGRVVACHGDPNPAVRGGGFRRLREAGIEVESGVLGQRAVRQTLRFLVPILLGRPMVTLKWAMSLDGRIATATGESQWISGPEGRRWGLDQREVHDAILVGIGTALADDPRLDRRLGRAPGPISRVVLDRRLRLPAEARMFSRPGPVVVYGRQDAPASRARALTAAGATVVQLAEVTPEAVLADLAGREIGSVLVEGGGEIHAAFVASGCFDRVAIDCAPMLVGGQKAPGPVAGEGLGPLAEVPRLEALTTKKRGEDRILTALRKGLTDDLMMRLDLPV